MIEIQRYLSYNFRERSGNMTKRKSITISLSPETTEILEELKQNTGIDTSKIIQGLLKQAKKNPILVNLIIKGLADEAGQRWLNSHNAQYKKPRDGYYEASAVSSNNQEDDNTVEALRQRQELEELLARL